MRALMAAAVALLAVATLSAAAPGGRPGGSPEGRPGGGSGLTDEGVGTYTDPSVANQISNFTINPRMVSCGVGTIAYGEFSGPFAMLMYARNINTYQVDRTNSAITATGTMRSITEIGDRKVEDVTHDFIAIAVDTGDRGGDRGDTFDVHFETDFWNSGNPLCTPSPLLEKGCRFGGTLILGDVAVG